MIRKLFLLSFFGFQAVSAGVNKPHVTVNLQNGVSSGIEVLDPTLSWSAAATALDCNFEMGCDVSIKPTLDVLSLPQNIWGKVSRKVLGWGLSSKVNVNVQKAGNVKLDVSAKNKELDTFVKLNSSEGRLQVLDVSQGFGVLGGRFSVNPRYNFKESTPDVVLEYDKGSTAVTLEASLATQKVTVSQEIIEGHRLIPAFTTDGDISLGYERTTAYGSIITTLKPNDSVVVQWNDGPWTAVIEAPLDGFSTTGINVSMKRKIELI